MVRGKAGDEVRRSKMVRERSVEVVARREVSTGLKATEVKVSTEVGHESVWLGVEEGRERS